MRFKINELKLPAFAFIDGSEHEPGGNPTEGRTLIFHIITTTVLEIFSDEDEFALNPETQTFKFSYKNFAGIKEGFTMAIHFSYAGDLQPVFEAAVEWYCDYCEWEDRNILNDEQGQFN